jgi:hypothetical protein
MGAAADEPASRVTPQHFFRKWIKCQRVRSRQRRTRASGLSTPEATRTCSSTRRTWKAQATIRSEKAKRCPTPKGVARKDRGPRTSGRSESGTTRRQESRRISSAFFMDGESHGRTQTSNRRNGGTMQRPDHQIRGHSVGPVADTSAQTPALDVRQHSTTCRTLAYHQKCIVGLALFKPE